jgi:hypothetical protein
MADKVKSFINRAVMWSIKNHWIFLIILVGVQSLTGSAMVDPKPWIPFSQNLLFTLHSFLGKLIFVLAIGLTLEKLYLWLLRRGKI